MRIPTAELEHVSKVLEAYAEAKIPHHVRDQVQLGYRIEGVHVFLLERRPGWDQPEPWTELEVAKFRYYVNRGEWVLSWADRNVKWHRYDLIPPSRIFEDLLDEVERDPTCIFWG